MEWMRCNSCWLKVESKQSDFHLTQCGHIFCNKCIAKAEERCEQCGSVGTISLPLKEPLSPQIAHYFTRTADLLEKLVQAEQFQDSQMSLCLKHADAHENKYQSLKEAYWLSAENLKKLYQKYNKLKMAVAAMQKQLKKTHSSTSYTPSELGTPLAQIKKQESFPHDYHDKLNQSFICQHDEQVFRVPTTTRVPRSVGYYTASSSSSSVSSQYRMNNSKSHFSNY